MQRADISKSGEQKKLIVAVGLGVIALVFLYWTFFGFGSSGSKPRSATSPSSSPRTAVASQTPPQNPGDIKSELGNQLQPVIWGWTSPPVTEAKRNIFAYYEPPKPPPAPEVTPTPTPTPTPPVLLASLSPSNVYARTSDFTLQITGDKFTPELRVSIDGRDLPTRFVGPQQLSVSVPALVIAAPGQRQVLLRSPDGSLYSNTLSLSVAQPPTPNYTYIGIIGTQRHVDTAILQDRNNREIINVQRGDVLGGRFRVTSISEKEVVFADTTLKIRHALALTGDGEKTYSPQQRPTPKVESEDDEPL